MIGARICYSCGDFVGSAAPLDLVVRPLDVDTWLAFAQLVEANNGILSGRSPEARCCCGGS